MKKNKPGKETEASEPQPAYGSTHSGKTIRFFKSFEEENEFVAKERAQLTHDQRMACIEILRKSIYKRFLQPDGNWIPLKKIIKLKQPDT